MSAPLEPVTPSTPGTQRPSRADQRGYELLQATALTRALDDAKAWRNGYAMLAGGLSALLGFIGTQLGHDTSWRWRVALSILLGGGLLCVSAALLLAITVEGGRRTVRLNLREIVQTHNSLEAYQAQQAAVALTRLDRSKSIAAVGAVMAFVGLVVTLWMPGKTDPAHRAPPPTHPPTTSAPSIAPSTTSTPTSSVVPSSPTP
jgi:hypothetical protein